MFSTSKDPYFIGCDPEENEQKRQHLANYARLLRKRKLEDEEKRQLASNKKPRKMIEEKKKEEQMVQHKDGMFLAGSVLISLELRRLESLVQMKKKWLAIAKNKKSGYYHEVNKKLKKFFRNATTDFENTFAKFCNQGQVFRNLGVPHKH